MVNRRLVYIIHDTGAVEIQGYLSEALQSMNEFHPTSSVSDGNSDASKGGGRAPEDPNQDQEMHTTSSGKQILYACFICSVGLNIKATNIHYT